MVDVVAVAPGKNAIEASTLNINIEAITRLVFSIDH
jgi:hypothetical protein